MMETLVPKLRVRWHESDNNKRLGISHMRSLIKPVQGKMQVQRENAVEGLLLKERSACCGDTRRCILASKECPGIANPKVTDGTTQQS
jgi:hypothetical protein